MWRNAKRFVATITVVVTISACGGQPSEDTESSGGPPSPPTTPSPAPNKPTVISTSPSGPANNNLPIVSGTSDPAAMILIYSDSACATQVGSGTANTSGAFAIQVNVVDNSTTTFYAQAGNAAGSLSACSASYSTYVEDSAPPALPTVAGVAPFSPANNNVPVISGLAEAHASIGLYSGASCATALATGIADAGGAFSISANVGDNTTTSIYARATDAAGNSSGCSSTSITFVEDSLSPAIPVLTGALPSGPANNNTPSVAGTTEGGANVTLYTNSVCTASLATGSASVMGAFSIVASVNDNSTTTIYAKATDAAGNSSSCSSTSVTYVEDSTPPAKPVLTSATPTGPADNNNPTVNGTAEANSSVTVYANATCATAITTGATTIAGTFAIPAAVTDNSTSTFYARAVDAAGNMSACSSTYLTYVEDSVAPTAPVITTATPSGPANENNPVISGTAEALAGVTLYSDAAYAVSLATGSANAGGAFAIAITVPDDSTTSVYGRATDGAGHDSPCSTTSVTYVEDSSGPVKPVVTAVAPVGPSNNNNPTVSGTSDPNVTVSLYGDSACTALFTSVAADGSGSWFATVPVTDDSTNYIYSKATDSSGNDSSCSSTFATYIEDSLALAPVITGVSPVGPANNNSPTVSGTAEANSTVTLYGNVTCASAPIGTATANGSGSFTAAVTVADNQIVTVYGKATDAVGNVSGCSSTYVAYVEDSTAPVLPIVLASNPGGPANNNSPQISGTAEANAVVKLYTDSACTIQVATVSASAGGIWSKFVSVADNSTTTVYATATDAAGNLSGCSSTFVAYVEDSMLPSMTVVNSVTPPGPANNNTPSISGAAEANDTVRIYLDASCTAVAATGTSDSSGVFAIPVSVADNSTSTFYARSEDSAHNLSPCSSTSVTYIEDSQPPDPPAIMGSSPASPASDNTPDITGTAEAAATVSLFGDPACATEIGSGSAAGDGTFSVTVAVSDNSLTDLFATATDAAGNTSVCSPTGFSYEEDSTAPAKPTITPLNVNRSDQTGLTFAGAAESDATVEIHKNSSCTNLAVSGPADGSGAFSIPYNAPLDTVVTYYAKAIDGAGNASPCSTTSVQYEAYSIASGIAFLTGTQTNAAATPTNFNQTAASFKWSASDFHSVYYGHSTASNSHRLTVKQSGDYLVSLTVPVSGSVTDASLITEVRVNGVESSKARGQSIYIKNSNSHSESSNNLSVFLEGLTANDVLDVTVARAGGSGSVTVSGRVTMTVEYIAPTRSIFSATATQTNAVAAPTDLNQATPASLQWTHSLNASAFTHSNSVSPESVTLNSTGPHLVNVNVPVTGSVTNGNVKIMVQLNGTTVAGGEGITGFISNLNGHTSSTVHWSGIIGATAGQILTVKTVSVGATGALSVVPGRFANIFIEQLSSSNNVFSGSGNTNTSGTNFNASSASPIKWTGEAFNDMTIYTHSITTNPQNVTVNQFGDYYLVVNSQGSNSAANVNVNVKAAVNGTAVSGAQTKTFFTKNTSGNTVSSGTMVILLRRVQAGQTITVTTQREARTGTTTNANTSVALIKK